MRALNPIHVLAFFTGFISLCVEIFWVRYVGFAWQGDPYSFGYVLSGFLTGIAVGAWHGKRLCEKHITRTPLLKQCVMWLSLTAVIIVIAPAIYAVSQGSVFMSWVGFFLIAISSFSLSVMFPIVHHLGVDSPQASTASNAEIGKHFSGVYCSNVAGAALGPLVCGYVFLQYFATQQVVFILAASSFATALIYMRIVNTHFFKMAGAAGLFASFLITSHVLMPKDWLLQKVKSTPEQPISKIIETRQGIVSIYKKDKGGDVVMGGNVYDGTSNLSLEINSNGLNRPLLMMALHPQPKRVLMVGLSIGSWLALVREFPGVEHIDVIEINPGYVKAIDDYPAQKAALNDPRVSLHIHDARRWLKLNPDQKYDLIFMNTTFHWRNNATLLLSQEYLAILKQRLLPGAVLAFNATGSLDALKTAAHVFPYARRYNNFVYAAEWDFTALPKSQAAMEKYKVLMIAGQPAFASTSKRPEQFLTSPFYDVQQDAKTRGRQPEVISDVNMISEFRYGRR